MNIQKFVLRIPLTLYSKLKQSAKNNERSINSEIVFAIKQYLGLTNDNKSSQD